MMKKATFPVSVLLLTSLLVGCPTATTPTATVDKAAQNTSIKSSISLLRTNIVALKGSFTSLQTSLATFFKPSAFRVQQTMNGVTWNDATKQLESIVTAGTTLTFAFTGQNLNKRGFTVNLTQSPDGTVGTAGIEIEADKWVSNTAEGEEAPPYEVWFNQHPADDANLSLLSGNASITPQGDATKKVECSGTMDTLADFSFRETDENGVSSVVARKIPTHLAFKATLSGLALDQNVTIQKGGTAQLLGNAKGSLTLTPQGQSKQTWTSDVQLQIDDTTVENSTGKVTFTFANTTMQYTLVGTVEPKGEKAVLNARFLDKNGAQLATLTFDPTAGDTAPTVTYADGTKETIALN